MNDLVVQVEDVVVCAAGRSILDVSRFTVSKGETVALVGPNGAGKTTQLHVSGLLKRPNAGSVAILGQTATPENAATLRRSLSLVLQDPLLFDVRVLANAAAGARFHGQLRREAERRAHFWLERFGVGHLAERKARSLSGGEARRVALARAFTTNPSVLLLDEPFSALDAPTRAAVLPALRARLQETGTAAVLVTHDLEEAFAFAHRIDLMDGGNTIASGHAAELIARPPSRRAAELLGVETIVPAQVASVADDFATLRLESAGPCLNARVPFNRNLIPGSWVIVTIPAGAVRVVPSEEDAPTCWNTIAGSVTSIMPVASGTRLTVETPTAIVAFSPWDPSARRWIVGDRAIVAFSRDAAHVIGSATDVR